LQILYTWHRSEARRPIWTSTSCRLDWPSRQQSLLHGHDQWQCIW
jgi:hypothetical protein